MQVIQLTLMAQKQAVAPSLEAQMTKPEREFEVGRLTGKSGAPCAGYSPFFQLKVFTFHLTDLFISRFREHNYACVCYSLLCSCHHRHFLRLKHT